MLGVGEIVSKIASHSPNQVGLEGYDRALLRSCWIRMASVCHKNDAEVRCQLRSWMSRADCGLPCNGAQ